MKSSKPPRPHALRTTIALLCGGTPLLLAAPALAAERVEEIVVTDRRPQPYTVQQSSLGKLTEALVDTPQSISVLTEQLLDDRGVMSLNDALPNVAENTFSLWLNYSVGADLQFGGGARFVDERLARNTAPLPLLRAPQYWAFDAMAKYDVNEHLTIKANLTNITDEYYFDQLHPFHVVPGPGFGAVFAVNLSY